MKNMILFFSFIISLSTVCDAQTQTKQIKANGIFSEIKVDKQNQTIESLNGENKKEKKLTIKSVMDSPNDYNPPVLYALSRELFTQGAKDEACYWFYLAQLRARYDANLCMDNSAKQAVSVLNNEYGTEINEYAFQDIDKLEKTVTKVVDFIRTNNENYDHRWINLHGMWAIQAGLNDKAETRELSKPEGEWEAIKKKTIDDYYNGFIEYVKSQKK